MRTAYCGLVSSVDGLKTADLVDSMGRLHRHRCHIHDAYCSGEATRWGEGEVTPFQANVPVVVSGVGVTPRGEEESR
jgi:hypothetical protein